MIEAREGRSMMRMREVKSVERSRCESIRYGRSQEVSQNFCRRGNPCCRIFLSLARQMLHRVTMIVTT